jgi:hypothetical protein
MGHRALIAYKRPDGQYNLHYSHWGALNLRLKHAITENAPFGGEKKHDGLRAYARNLRASNVELDVEEFVESTADTHVDVEPREIAIEFEEILRDHLDYLHHEAFYVVDLNFEVTAYRTLWFGMQYAADSIANDPTVGNGAIRTVRWYQCEPVGDGYAKGEFEGTKDVVGDMLDRDVFSYSQALGYLERKVVAQADSEELLIRTPRVEPVRG